MRAKSLVKPLVLFLVAISVTTAHAGRSKKRLKPEQGSNPSSDKQPSSVFPFIELPEEVIVNIFDFLKDPDHTYFGSTCTTMKGIRLKADSYYEQIAKRKNITRQPNQTWRQAVESHSFLVQAHIAQIQEDHQALRKNIEKAAADKNEKALHLTALGLLNGEYGFQQDKIEGRKMITEYAENYQHPWALELHLIQLEKQKIVCDLEDMITKSSLSQKYSANPILKPESNEIIEYQNILKRLSSEGIECPSTSKTLDQRIKDMIEKYSNKPFEHPWALQAKIKGLLYGVFGIKPDKKASHDLLDKYSKDTENHPWAASMNFFLSIDPNEDGSSPIVEEMYKQVKLGKLWTLEPLFYWVSFRRNGEQVTKSALKSFQNLYAKDPIKTKKINQYALYFDKSYWFVTGWKKPTDEKKKQLVEWIQKNNHALDPNELAWSNIPEKYRSIFPSEEEKIKFVLPSFNP